jgi:hypothetical protein
MVRNFCFCTCTFLIIMNSNMKYDFHMNESLLMNLQNATTEKYCKWGIDDRRSTISN